MELVAAEGRRVLLEYFENHATADERQTQAARIAASVISSAAKERMSRGGSEALQFSICREMAENARQFRKFIAKTLPEAAAVKALEAIEAGEPDVLDDKPKRHHA